MNRAARRRPGRSGLWLGAGALALALAATGCSEVRPDAATVNGVSIPRNEFEDQLQAYVDNEEYQAYLASQNGATLVGPGGDSTVTMGFTGSTLRVSILFELVRQEVERRELTVTPETQLAAEEQAKTRFAPAGEAADAVWAEFPTWFQDQAIEDTANLLTLQQALGTVELDDAALQAVYDENPALFGQLCARHILVGTEEEAAALKAELDAGADFAEVASANGTDASAANGGLLYTEGEECPAAAGFDSDFVAGAVSVPTGQVTDPVQTQFGWHLILVDEAVVPPFEEVEDEVRSYATERASAGVDTALTELLREAGRGDITVNPRYGTWDPATTTVVAPGLGLTTTTTTTTATGSRRGVGRVTVIGLGPAGPELLTTSARAAIERTPHRFVRTRRHPAASAVGDATSFDEAYDAAERLEDVYESIVDTLLAAASREHGDVLYAVPGSPLVAERTVALLRERAAAAAVEVVVEPALSYLDLAWVALGVDPLAAGVRLVDGHRFAVEAAGERGPLLVAQCDHQAVLSEIKLAVDGEPAVTVLQRLGLPDQSIRTVAWADLDREVEPDHLTTLWIPSLAAPVGAELVRFHELVRTLRAACPWDREQTHTSLKRHLLEETYEVLDAIDVLDVLEGVDAAGAVDVDGYDALEEELGDLLFQVVFHSVLGAEAGRFTLADVAQGIHDKLVYRHPHVFEAAEVEGTAGVLRSWEQLKAAEKERPSLMDGIPAALPALAYAAKVQKKAASVGFDWDDVQGALPKIAEELGELAAVLDAPAQATEELGDLLFAVVNVARHLGVDAEGALRAATSKFRQRFEGVERLAAARGLDLRALDLAGLDRLWDDVKAGGAHT